ncbi:uncharacterized protein LOC114244427 [Bombyx mandarina]|uniref:Uncharacterized protein LOC114244427 n=1 Tax=Bombyx mandarina TaxID=7092 RepID=A0A6J2JRX1_BOMMA|nr:uncharacterized protein LOC114244427 [Bombyx mandarina]
MEKQTMKRIKIVHPMKFQSTSLSNAAPECKIVKNGTRLRSKLATNKREASVGGGSIPDPTLPHLKYGMFAKKNVNRSQNKTVISSNDENTKTFRAQDQQTRSPTTCVKSKSSRRPVATRNLGISQIYHVDVKPQRKLPISPTHRATSPLHRNYRNRKLHLSPKKRASLL